MNSKYPDFVSLATPVHDLSDSIYRTTEEKNQEDRLCSDQFSGPALVRPTDCFSMPYLNKDSLNEIIFDDHATGQSSNYAEFLSNPWRPYVLLLYFHLIINIIIILVAAFLGYLIVSTLRADINQNVEFRISDALNEISACSKKYYKNKCFNDENNRRAPALEQTCDAWERCMNRNPLQLVKSKITAETLAEVLNSFLSHLSWKSLFLLSSVVFGSVFLTKYSFEKLRHWPENDRSDVKNRLMTLENKFSNKNKNRVIHDLNFHSFSAQDPGPLDALPSICTSAVSLNSPLSGKGMRRIK